MDADEGAGTVDASPPTAGSPTTGSPTTGSSTKVDPIPGEGMDPLDPGTSTGAGTGAGASAVGGSPTTGSPTTGSPTTGSPTTGSPTTDSPTTGSPTTGSPTASPRTGAPSNSPTTNSPTNSPSTSPTGSPTSLASELGGPSGEAPNGSEVDATHEPVHSDMNMNDLGPPDSEVVVTVINTTIILPVTWDHLLLLIAVVVILVITVCCIVLICFKNQKAKDDNARPQMSPTNSGNVVIKVDSNRSICGVPELKKVSHSDINSEKWIVDQVVQCPSPACSAELGVVACEDAFTAPQPGIKPRQDIQSDERMIGMIDINTLQTRIDALLNRDCLEREFKSCDPETNVPECPPVSWWDADHEERIVDEINARNPTRNSLMEWPMNPTMPQPMSPTISNTAGHGFVSHDAMSTLHGREAFPLSNGDQDIGISDQAKMINGIGATSTFETIAPVSSVATQRKRYRNPNRSRSHHLRDQKPKSLSTRDAIRHPQMNPGHVSYAESELSTQDTSTSDLSLMALIRRDLQNFERLDTDERPDSERSSLRTRNRKRSSKSNPDHRQDSNRSIRRSLAELQADVDKAEGSLYEEYESRRASNRRTDREERKVYWIDESSSTE